LGFEGCLVVERFGGFGAEVREDALYLRDDFAGFVDDDSVADADVEAGDFVGVVEGGVADGGAGDLDWVEDGDWGGGAGAAERDDDVADCRRGFFGGEFVGDSSSRGFADDAELVENFSVIKFDNYAIAPPWKLVAMGVLEGDVIC